LTFSGRAVSSVDVKKETKSVEVKTAQKVGRTPELPEPPRSFLERVGVLLFALNPEGHQIV
jgi:hypothetical protein